MTEVGRPPSCLSPPRVATAWQRGWRRPSPWDCAPVGLPARRGRGRRVGQAAVRPAPRKEPRSPSRVPGRCIAAGTGVAHPLFLIPLPQRGRGSRRGGTLRTSGVEGRRGTHPEARGGASSPPHPSLSPQGERERRTRTAREGSRSPSRAPGRCIAAGRRVAHPLFLIPLPRRGRGSRRGGTLRRRDPYMTEGPVTERNPRDYVAQELIALVVSRSWWKREKASGSGELTATRARLAAGGGG